MRKTIIYRKNEYYHIYNRGVDKRIIFTDKFDLQRFYQSMEEFNSVEPIGSIFENRFNLKNRKESLGGATPKYGKLVEIVAYCLNPNHYHLILTSLVEGGISEYMRRLNSGYTTYFNQRYKRTGSLFGGTFKSVYINSDSYLRFLSVYVNLNFEVHQKFQNVKDKKLFHKSSWDEYIKVKIIKGKRGEENQVINNKNDICDKSMISSHFDSVDQYKKFALESLKDIKAKRYKDSEVIKKTFETSKGF
ncbi:MAG: transposase [Candidatus Pacebacteria bacterium]|nr:transposase [Candidatus Paceibacterota bacterium]